MLISDISAYLFFLNLQDFTFVALFAFSIHFRGGSFNSERLNRLDDLTKSNYIHRTCRFRQNHFSARILHFFSDFFLF